MKPIVIGSKSKKTTDEQDKAMVNINNWHLEEKQRKVPQTTGRTHREIREAFSDHSDAAYNFNLLSKPYLTERGG